MSITPSLSKKTIFQGTHKLLEEECQVLQSNIFVRLFNLCVIARSGPEFFDLLSFLFQIVSLEDPRKFTRKFRKLKSNYPSCAVRLFHFFPIELWV